MGYENIFFHSPDKEFGNTRLADLPWMVVVDSVQLHNELSQVKDKKYDY